MAVVAVILAFFVYGMITAMLGTILPGLSQKFQLTPKQNGNIALAQAVGLIIAAVSAGPAIDMYGYKAGLVCGFILVVLALSLLPRSGGYGQIALLLFLLGTGGGIIVTGSNSLAYDVGGSQGAAEALNFLNLFFGLGGLATPFISANLLKRDATRLCYLTAVLALITLGVYASITLPAPKSAGGIAPSQLASLLGQPALWMLAAMLFLYVACEVGTWNWLARHLVAQGIPEPRALNILSLGFALGLLLGRVAVTPLFKTLSAETVTLGASVLMAITTLFALQSRRPAVAWPAAFLSGIAMAPVFPTTLAITGRAYPATQATAIGFVTMFGWIGLAVSSRLIGAIAGEDPKRLKKALLLLPAFSALMIIVNLALRAVL